MATDKPRFTITVSDDTLNEIVNFQHDRNLATRSNAIQQLIQIGIDDLKNQTSAIPRSLSSDSIEIAKKYESLDLWGKRTVNRVLDAESERVKSAQNSIHTPTRPKNKIVPLFGNSFAAGPAEPDFGNMWTDYEIPSDSRAEFAIKIHGQSMEPYLQDDSIALGIRRTPQLGEIGAFLVDGQYVVKQFVTDGRNVYLVSLNRDYADDDLTLWADEDHTVHCFGTILTNKTLPKP